MTARQPLYEKQIPRRPQAADMAYSGCPRWAGLTRLIGLGPGEDPIGDGLVIAVSDEIGPGFALDLFTAETALDSLYDVINGAEWADQRRRR